MSLGIEQLNYDKKVSVIIDRDFLNCLYVTLILCRW